jgi:sugar lactone lactonase YvrE
MIHGRALTYQPRNPERAARRWLWIIVGVVSGWMAWQPVEAQVSARFSYAQSAVGGSGLNAPAGVAVDLRGNLYIADTNNNRVLRVPPTDRSCATAGDCTSYGSGLSDPYAAALDSSGNVYIADYLNNRVLKVPPSDPSCATPSDCTTVGIGLSGPISLAIDSSGNIYISDHLNDRVLEAPASDPACSTPTDCVTVGSGLGRPSGVAVDASGNVYIADGSNNRVLKVPPSDPSCATPGDCTTVGSGLNAPFGVAVDANGNVFIGDATRVLKVPPSDPTCATAGDCTTVGDSFSFPLGLAAGPNGNVYIADYVDNRVLREQTQGVDFGPVAVKGSSPPQFLTYTLLAPGSLGTPSVLTQGVAGLDFADSGTGSCTTNGSGHAYAAGDICTVSVTMTPAFVGPRHGAAVLDGPSGKLVAGGYVFGLGRAPQVGFAAPIQTTLGSGLNNPGLNQPIAMAVDGAGNVYIADSSGNRVLKVPPTDPACSVPADCTTVGSGLHAPGGVAVDGEGNVLIADGGNGRILKVPPTDLTCATPADCTTVGSGLTSPFGVAVDGSGDVYISDKYTNLVSEVPPFDPACSVAGYCTTWGGSFHFPAGIAVDAGGNLYVADLLNYRVLRIPRWDPTCAASGSCTVVAGSVVTTPRGVAVDGAGNVYIAHDEAVTRVAAADLTCAVAADCTSVGSGLYSPSGVAVDPLGNVYIADTANNRVLKEDYGSVPSLSFAATGVGAVSADSPQSVTVLNIGNVALLFPALAAGNNPSISAGFALAGTSTCPVAGTSSPATLAVGASCVLAVDFQPVSAGSAAGSLVLTDNALNAAAPAYVTQTIALSGTGQLVSQTITFAPPASPVGYGVAPMALSATSTSGLPVSFSIVSGPATLSGAQLTVLGSGTIVVAAAQSGNAQYSAAAQVTQTLVVTPAATTTTLAASAVSLGLGQPLTLTAQVGSGAGTPTGSVQFYDGAQLLGAASLSAGAAGLSTSALSVGTHMLTVTYGGAANFATSTNSVAVNVVAIVPPTSSTTLAASASDLSPGQSLSLTAHVASPSGTPTGSVQFYDGTTLLATAPLSAGTASYSTAALPIGTDTLTATYVGNTTWSGSQSPALPVVVAAAVAAPSSTTLGVSASELTPGENLTLTAQVRSAGGTPSGSVNFYDGAALLGTAPLAAETASYATSGLALGTHAITASYVGDASFGPSSSSPAAVDVVGLGFTLSTEGATTQSVIEGGAASYTLQVAPTNQIYPGVVTLTATNLPPGAVATFSPVSVAADGGVRTVTLRVQTGAVARLAAAAPVDALASVGVMLLLPGARRRARESCRRARSRWKSGLVLLAVLAGFAALAGCGAPNGFPASQPAAGQPQQYAVTVTATSGSIQHSVIVNLTVQ